MKVLLFPILTALLSVLADASPAVKVLDNNINIGEDAVTTVIDSSDYDDISIPQVAPETQPGRECIFEHALKRKLREAPDVELLSCDIGKMCVEDSSSSSGGRCAIVSGDGDAAVIKPRLEDECEKCAGDDACEGSDQDKIGCGSCNIAYACQNLGTDVTIGTNSCNGVSSCYEAQGESNPKKGINFG